VLLRRPVARLSAEPVSILGSCRVDTATAVDLPLFREQSNHALSRQYVAQPIALGASPHARYSHAEVDGIGRHPPPSAGTAAALALALSEIAWLLAQLERRRAKLVEPLPCSMVWLAC
jgi:hypothetical protein